MKGSNRCARDIQGILEKQLGIEAYAKDDSEEPKQQPSIYARKLIPLAWQLQADESSRRKDAKSSFVYQMPTASKELFFVGWPHSDSDSLNPDSLARALFANMLDRGVSAGSVGRVIPVHWTGGSGWDQAVELIKDSAIPALKALPKGEGKASTRVAVVVKTANCNRWTSASMRDTIGAMVEGVERTTIVEDYHGPDVVLHVYAIGAHAFVSVCDSYTDLEGWRLARWLRVAKEKAAKEGQE